MEKNTANDPTVILILPSETLIDSEKKSLLDKIKPLETDSLIYQVQHNFETLREPLGIESIAAYLRENAIQVEMVFFDLEKANEEAIIHTIKQKNVIFIGFSVLFDLHLIHALWFSGRIKESTNLPIFFGGALVSFISESLLHNVNWIDGIIIGEGEQTCLMLAEAIQEKREIQNIPGLHCRNISGAPSSALVKATKIDLCKLPPPARDFHITAKKLNILMNQAAIYTSRGCPEKCVFCTGNTFTSLTVGKAWRYRDALEVVDEIEQIISHFSINYFYICDDNFVGYGKGALERIECIVEELIKRNIKTRFHYECRVDAVNDNLLSILKKAGFIDILLGIEAGVDTMLTRWGKSITVAQNRNAILCARKNGLNLKSGFILFDKYTSLKELEGNLRFVQEMKLNTPECIFDIFNPMQYFWGSKWDRKEYKTPYHGSVNINDRDSINEYVYSLCDKSYEIQDERVYIFWEVVSPVLDVLCKYMSIEIAKELYNRHIRSAKPKDVLSYISRYKKWQNDIGDILIEMSLMVIENLKIHAKRKIVEKEMYLWYRNRELCYFDKGMVEDFESLLVIL